MKYIISQGLDIPGRRARIEFVKNLLDLLPPEKTWSVEIKQHRKRRTTDQNSKFHAMCQELGQEVGYTCEELKRLVKKEIGACQIVDGPLGKVLRFESSADWDRQRMAEAIELLYRWGIDADHVWRVE